MAGLTTLPVIFKVLLNVVAADTVPPVKTDTNCPLPFMVTVTPSIFTAPSVEVDAAGIFVCTYDANKLAVTVLVDPLSTTGIFVASTGLVSKGSCDIFIFAIILSSTNI